MTKLLNNAHKKNFDTLCVATVHNDIALLECTLKEDIKAGQKIAVVCASSMDETGETTFTPFAMLFNGNPYEMLKPPMEDFVRKKKKK